MQDNIFYSNNSTKFQNWRFYTGNCELSYWKLNIHLVSYTFLTWINERNKASIAVLQSKDGHHSTKSVQMHFTAKLLEGCSGIRQTFSRFLTTGQKVHVGFVLQDTSDWWWKTKGYLLDTGSAAAVHETSVVLKVKLINCSIPTKSVPWWSWLMTRTYSYRGTFSITSALNRHMFIIISLPSGSSCTLKIIEHPKELLFM